MAVFAAIVIHTLIVVTIYFFDLRIVEVKEKTIPFKLISASRGFQPSTSTRMSAEENARAAQEYLSSLSQSEYKAMTQNDHSKQIKDGSEKQRNRQQTSQQQKQTTQNQPLFRTSNPSSAISGLQDIFTQKNLNVPQNTTKQISSKDLEKLSEYETVLLNTLNKGALYDSFHEVMKDNQKEQVAYTITLFLFPNGAIKSASIKKASGLAQIDELAIQAAYRASPFPAPPRDDIQIGYKYHIPIIIKNP